jgi:hypothetical protein
VTDQWAVFADGEAIEDGFYSIAQAEAAAKEMLRTDHESGDTDVRADYYSVVLLCPEHEGQPKDGCELCCAEPEEEPAPKAGRRGGKVRRLAGRGRHGE